MTDYEVSIRVDEDEVMRGFDRQQFLAKELLKDLLDNVGRFGYDKLVDYIPRHSDYLWRHADRSSVRWSPGGAGGGGEYEVTVGIKAGTSQHPFYVRGGTGIYGPNKRPYGAKSGGRMWFYSAIYGRVIGIESVKGQKPNPYLEETYADMRIYLHAQIVSGQLRLLV
jgi:hypothetical protein